MTQTSNFLYPYRRYQGVFTPQNVVFDANLQEFAQNVSFICNLENNGKLSPQEAYLRLQVLWHELDGSHHWLS